jgi:outer membrane lipoprotein-sorting protein
MRLRSLAIAALALVLAACATTLPPAARVSDLRALAGTYSGTMEERGLTLRPTRLVINPDGSFEITVADPRGFRTNGSMILDSDGTLAYLYDQLKGRGAVYEGEGRRVVVLSQGDGQATITIERKLP